MSCCRNNIGNHRAGCRKLSCPLTVEHSISKAVSYNTDSVIDSVYKVKRVILSYHNRSHISKVLVFHRFYRSEKADMIAHLFGIRHIDIGNISDSFSVDILVTATHSRRHGKKNRCLSGGIKAIYIRRRILLRISETLCFL